mgnify:CR=1 FL=1
MTNFRPKAPKRRPLPMLEVPAIDWHALVSALQAKGYSLREIGHAMGLSHATVQAWIRGHAPMYEHGLVLLTLAKAAGCMTFHTNDVKKGDTSGDCTTSSPSTKEPTHGQVQLPRD